MGIQTKEQLEEYLDQHYAPQGGSRKLRELMRELDTKPMSQNAKDFRIAEHFGVNPFTVMRWRKKYERD